jgi:hypothetical protein
VPRLTRYAPYAAPATTTPMLLGRTVDRRALGIGIGVARVAVGIGATAAPVPSVRMLGIDTATARRAVVLARMAAARDLALGVGTVVAARRGRDTAAWLLAGAAADAADAVIIGTALRQRGIRSAAGWLAVAAALGAAVAGVVVARR